MDLVTLFQLQESGALKVKINDVTHSITVGGVAISEDECEALIKKLGWTRWSKKPWEIIKITDSFIKSLRCGIDNEAVVIGATITMFNMRLSDSEKCFNRYKIISPNYDITVLHGMPRIGGAYAIYNESNNFNSPVFNSRTSRGVAEYMNSMLT